MVDAVIDKGGDGVLGGNAGMVHKQHLVSFGQPKQLFEIKTGDDPVGGQEWEFGEIAWSLLVLLPRWITSLKRG